MARDPEISPELFVGLIGAVGTDLETVQLCLQSELVAVGYNVHNVRLSKLISRCYNWRHLNSSGVSYEDERINTYMDAGDELRGKMNDGAALARLAIGNIREIREAEIEHPDSPMPATAFVLQSLKHPDEVKFLREIYGKSFIALSIYSPKQRRLQRLKHIIAKSRHSANEDSFEDHASALIKRDEKEPGDDNGQNVRDTFPLADAFFSAGPNLAIQIKRFLQLLFGQPYITPSSDEYAMYHAHAAALRSSDLSRQVGAVLTTTNTEFIAAGCNEVPQAGGGSPWENSVDPNKDYRDHQLGKDSNVLIKHEMTTEIFKLMKENGWLSEEKRREEPASLAETAFSKKVNGILRDTRIASIIEFGRMIHAEMSAICEAARRGIPVQDTTLYCTTFPCHMCARHIIASGISRVVYIEPYPKSLTKELYNKSVHIEDDGADDDAVTFEPFVGIAPRTYMPLFTMRKRKDDLGYTVDWNAEDTIPKLCERYPVYIDRETADLQDLNEHAIMYGIDPPTE